MIGSLIALLTAVSHFRLLVSFVANNAFPQPLSEAEESACLRAMAKGDEKARAKLIEHNLRLVAHIVKKFNPHQDEAEDLISIGTIGLMKAINTFDPDKNAKLATYAARCIENEILMYMRATKRVRAEAHLWEPIGVDKEGNEITLLDTLPSNGPEVIDLVEEALEQDRLRSLLTCLTQRERLVLEMRYGLLDGRRAAQHEVAKKLDISRSYVSRIEKRAIEKMIEVLRAAQHQRGDGD